MTYRIQAFQIRADNLHHNFETVETEDGTFAQDTFKAFARNGGVSKVSIKYPNGRVNWARGVGGLNLNH